MKLSKTKLTGLAYVASFSAGKDSLAMVLRLILEGYPLTHVIFFDTGMEFNAIYRNVERIKTLCESKGIIFQIITPPTSFLEEMLIIPHCKGKCNEHFGYDWCGRSVRWRTADKISYITTYEKTLGDYVQYIGYAADEQERLKKHTEQLKEDNEIYPLSEWGMTEADCLKYCYDHGYDWKEGEYDLYQKGMKFAGGCLLKRVSCWCCANKNLDELRNIYHFLPDYWWKLKGLQTRIDRPFRDDQTIFDLEKRFQAEDAQMTWDEYLALVECQPD